MWEKFQESANNTGDAGPYTTNIDEIREMRLQLLNYENSILRTRAQELTAQLNDMTHKNHELEASFDLLSDTLVQCIKHLQTDDAKLIVSQLLATVAKVNDRIVIAPDILSSSGGSGKIKPQPIAGHLEINNQQQHLSSPSQFPFSGTPQTNTSAVVTPVVEPIKMMEPSERPVPSHPSKPKIPQLSLDHVEPSAWLRGEQTAGDVYRP